MTVSKTGLPFFKIASSSSSLAGDSDEDSMAFLAVPYIFEPKKYIKTRMTISRKIEAQIQPDLHQWP